MILFNEWVLGYADLLWYFKYFTFQCEHKKGSRMHADSEPSDLNQIQTPDPGAKRVQMRKLDTAYL